MYRYIITVLIFVGILGIFFFAKYKNKWKNFLLTTLIVLIVHFSWEKIVVNLGLLNFNNRETLGYILGLPIDEYIFVILGSFMVLGLYELVLEKLKKVSRKNV